MKRVFSVVILLALVVTSAILLKGRAINDAEAVSNSFMEQVRVLNRESGKHRWTLLAQKVLIASDGKLSRLNDVTIDLPEHGMKVSSDAGVYDLDSRDLTLEGNIVARTEDYTISTRSIHIETASGNISSPDKVVLEGERFRIEGEGFDAASDKVITLKNNVKATFF